MPPILVFMARTNWRVTDWFSIVFVLVLECGASNYDSLQWLDAAAAADTSSSGTTLNGGVVSTVDHAMSSSAAINDNFLNSQRQQLRRDGYNISSETDNITEHLYHKA